MIVSNIKAVKAVFSVFCCENVVSVCVSRTGGSLQGLSGLSPSARSECQCIPEGPGGAGGGNAIHA